ncbi:MAG: tRNA lysidine(34) synthetase TilS [Bacteroidetes bacterium]|nr:tRNA lysidine(34) synthetase TilS [Bacteroidota bacterium]
MNKHAASVKNFELLTSDYISGIEKELLQEKWGGVLKTISLKKLFSYPVPEFLLFLLIGKYGFNETVCNAIFSSNRTGAEFLAPGFRLVLDRDELVLFNLNSIHDANIYLIDQFTHSLKLMPGIFDMKKVVWSSADAVQVPDDFRNKETVYLDASKLKLPLSIRRWKDGDSFHPLGMKGSKLISDFLTDEKLPVAEKELVYLLLSENEIVWVLGQRLDEKYRITSSTLEAWKCTYLIN